MKPIPTLEEKSVTLCINAHRTTSECLERFPTHQQPIRTPTNLAKPVLRPPGPDAKHNPEKQNQKKPKTDQNGTSFFFLPFFTCAPGNHSSVDLFFFFLTLHLTAQEVPQ
jgi:hypothetical protein